MSAVPCRFVSVVNDWTCSHFALVSRPARIIEVESGYIMRLVPDRMGRQQTGPWSSAFPPPGRLARRVDGVNGGACVYRAKT